MKKLTKTILNLNLHQPLRLNPEKEHFLWDEKNKAVFREASADYYLPTLELLANSLAKNPEFRFNLGISGTFLEQAKEYSPELLNFMKDMINAGTAGNQIELLGETYYASLAEFFKDPSEFNNQISKQKNFLKQEFNVTPTTFRHTKRPFSTFVGEQLKQNGYKVILTDIPHKDFRETAYRLQDTTDVVVLKRNIPLSHKLSRGRLDAKQFSAEQLERYHVSKPSEKKAIIYIYDIQNSKEPVLLSYTFGRIGNKSLRPFWKEFIKHSKGRINFTLANKLYNSENIAPLPEIYIPIEHSVSHLKNWQEASIITNGLIDNRTEFELFKQIEQLFTYPRASLTSEDKRHRSILTSYFNFRFLDAKDDSPDIQSNPYGNPVDATYQFTRKVDDLETRLKKETAKFEILKRRAKDIFLTASPELTETSEEIAPLGAVPVNSFGGMAIVASGMANYLAEQGFDSRILTLDMTKNYNKKARDNYRQKVAADMKVHEEKVYLVKSFAFDNVKNPYNDLSPEFVVAEAQNYAMKYVFLQLLKEDRSIMHIYHDQIFGGVSAAVFKYIADTLQSKGDARLLKNFQYSHSPHSIVLDMNNFKDLPWVVKEKYLYLTNGNPNSLLTGFKSANGIFFVSPQWLNEVLWNSFPDRVPANFTEETRIQNAHGKITSILNGLPKDRYPEYAECLKHPSLYFLKDDFPNVDKTTLDLITPFDPESNFLEAKARNKRAFQRLAGLKEDPDAILFVYSGRYDFYQKQCDILEEKIPYLIHALAEQGINMQMAYISNPVNDPKVLQSYHNITMQALASNGTMVVIPHSLSTEILATAGAHGAIGTSIMEMCGLNDELAIMYGTIPAFTGTGGLIDKIQPLSIAGYKGATETKGNGILFGTNKEDIWFGLKDAAEIADYLRQRPALNQEILYNIMVNGRQELSMDRHGREFVAAIEKTIGRPLQ